MEDGGLAAMAVSGSKASGTYGDGNGNTIKSAYGGLLDKKKEVVVEDSSKPKEYKSYSGVRG